MAMIGLHSWEDDDRCARCGETRRNHHDGNGGWGLSCNFKERKVAKASRGKPDIPPKSSNQRLDKLERAYETSERGRREIDTARNAFAKLTTEKIQELFHRVSKLEAFIVLPQTLTVAGTGPVAQDAGYVPPPADPPPPLDTLRRDVDFTVRRAAAILNIQCPQEIRVLPGTAGVRVVMDQQANNVKFLCLTGQGISIGFARHL